MQEGGNLSPANRTLVSLHPHNLTAVDAEAHMSAREYNCILRGSVANHAFFFSFHLRDLQHCCLFRKCRASPLFGCCTEVFASCICIS